MCSRRLILLLRALFPAGIWSLTANSSCMKKTTQTLTTTELSWQARAEKAEAQVASLLHEMEYLKAQMRLLTAKRYGASSEKCKQQNSNQLSLFDSAFNEAEASAEPFAPEPELITVPAHKRKKSKGKKGQLLEGLPENVIEYHLPEEEMVCSCCGNLRHVIRQEVTRELVVVPPQFSVNVHVQDVCGCRHCESNGDGTNQVIVTAPKPKRAFPGSIASPSVVAHVIEEKYVMEVPFYRQEQQWVRRGILLSRQNMANWVVHAAQNWFEPVYNRMKETLLGQDIIMADETSVQVLREDGKAPESKSFMWVYRSGRYGPSMVLYEYQPSRSQDHPKAFLRGFKGYLITDAYAAYADIPDVTNSGCWAHARRKFDEAIKASGGKTKNPKALEGLEFINKLYDVEQELRDNEPQSRYEERLLRSKPMLEAFLAWLQKTNEESLPQTHLDKAINYCLKQWQPLNTFLLDGRLEIDNNRTERSIKSFVIARKNFLFCVAPYSAKASAITFSLVESAKENGLKPFEYLKYLLEELPNAASQDLDRYLPWSEDIPDYCRTPKNK